MKGGNWGEFEEEKKGGDKSYKTMAPPPIEPQGFGSINADVDTDGTASP